MEAFVHDAQSLLTVICVIGFLASFAALAVVRVFPLLWDKLRSLFSLPKIQLSLVLFASVGIIYYGSTKGGKITFSNGIKNDPQNSSLVTNNTIALRWVRDTSGGTIVPATATVYIDYRLASDTNQPFAKLAQTTVGAWQYNAILQDATNYEYAVYAYYIPPEPVHTNGVWQYKTLKDRHGVFALPLRSRVEEDGKAIATPCEKRKDAQ